LTREICSHSCDSDVGAISEVDAFFQWHPRSGRRNSLLSQWLIRRKIASLEKDIQAMREILWILLVSKMLHSSQCSNQLISPRVCKLNCNYWVRAMELLTQSKITIWIPTSHKSDLNQSPFKLSTPGHYLALHKPFFGHSGHSRTYHSCYTDCKHGEWDGERV